MRRLFAGVCVVLAMGLALPAIAQEAEGEGDEPQKRRGWRRQAEPEDGAQQKALRPHPKVYERHAKALELIFEEKWDEAQAQLDKLFLRRYSAYDVATVQADYGLIANGRGDRPEARRRFQLAIDAGGFPPSNAADMRFKIAGLWMQDEEWSKAAETLEAWFDETPDEPNASSYYLLGLCYYQDRAYEKALEPVETAATLTDEPKEAWLQLLLALHLIEKRYEAAIPVLQALVSEYPKQSYWKSLSTVHGALGSYEKALVPLQLAYEDGQVEAGPDLLRMAQLMMFVGLPYRAAEALQTALDAGAVEGDEEALTMLGNSWIAAREYKSAIPPLNRAASLAENGELYVRLAQVHVQREEYEPAAEALGRALDKGGLRSPGDAQLLLGIVNYSRKRPALAERSFQRAAGHKETRGEAEVWLQHLAQERAQAEAAAAAAAAAAEAAAEAAARGEA